ncbi:SDR family NAD(P)-dependent oxidoreductase [Flagellimonas nanhaiensis]|uniref:SDR family NAD(P)-dependent oxidoreductase n=1 Tax=Flagellimonas nanhaiensis TaxID=2292706 RepID=A0A371JRA7_9FLAO|nr:SDR family NAD(P)-dependent oxidoreductase [Allomuricauda nanhaiensis]RDY60037.1 SDR family NAD(P)-dependent oxidoreductase [Allomuricauda nanhaiensis]
MDFSGKKVLITGASRGIGKATAMAFAEKGAQVGLNYRNNIDEAKRTLKEMPGKGHQLFQKDIGKTENCKELIQEFIETYGRLDILVNNAGIFQHHKIDEIDFEEWTQTWETTFRTNLYAAAHLSYWASQKMMKSGGGRIVNVSSRGAFRGEPNAPAYGASKAALNAMSQSLAKKLAPHNIFVGVVAPGFTETEMGANALTPEERERLLAETSFKRMAKPEEVAHAILFLASEGAEYCSGAIIDVNGASYLRS